jgi:hypothetical protein
VVRLSPADVEILRRRNIWGEERNKNGIRKKQGKGYMKKNEETKMEKQTKKERINIKMKS